ncbi:MAG TPA: hypothetical protein VG710_00665 [Opitutus sp.]|nr:hypothetical protein [Opitutus sp.]
MKTTPQPSDSSPRRAALAVVLLNGFVFSSVISPAATAALSEAKDHVLFVGTDLDVRMDGKFYHVVGASKEALKIEKDHQVADVRMGHGADVRISKGVKLSDLSATIANIQTESVDRASARAQLEAMKSSLMLSEEADMQADRLQGAMLQAGMVAVNSASPVRGAAESAAAIQAAQQQAVGNYSGGLPGLDLLSDSANTYLMSRVEQKDQTEVDLSFDVSSPQPIDNAYLVVVANYGDKKGNIARQISARDFGHIGSQSQHVTMSHAASINGLPFTKFDVALFADGQEVATNLSEKRTPLTNDEAYQYFFVDYLSAHKGATLPPAAMLMTPRMEFRRQIEGTDATQSVYARVDKNGNIVAMSADKAGTQKLPPATETALQNVRFMPALKGGAPVEGQVKVTLAQLAN